MCAGAACSSIPLLLCLHWSPEGQWHVQWEDCRGLGPPQLWQSCQLWGSEGSEVVCYLLVPDSSPTEEWLILALISTAQQALATWQSHREGESRCSVPVIH